MPGPIPDMMGPEGMVLGLQRPIPMEGVVPGPEGPILAHKGGKRWCGAPRDQSQCTGAEEGVCASSLGFNPSFQQCEGTVPCPWQMILVCGAGGSAGPQGPILAHRAHFSPQTGPTPLIWPVGSKG